MKRILTAAALAAALLSSAPRAAAACPYTVGPFGAVHRPGHCARHDRHQRKPD